MGKIKGWEKVCDRVVDNIGDLEKDISSDSAVVFFMASWCGPCRNLTLEAEGDVDYFNKNGVKSIYVDVDGVDGDVGMKSRYGVGAIPTVLSFNNGKLVDSMVGLGTYDVFRKNVCGK